MTTSPVISKSDASEIAGRQRIRLGVSWRQVAEAIDRPLVWAVAAVLGQHPLTRHDAATLGGLLELDALTVEALTVQPYRSCTPATLSDPTIYRFYEALMVYGPALKELVHESCGDGIMSAINFNLEFADLDHDGEKRIEVTFNGKYLPYVW